MGQNEFHKLDMSKFLYDGEQYCPNCHIKCNYDEKHECFRCPNGDWDITLEEAEDGDGYPTEEASYEEIW